MNTKIKTSFSILFFLFIWITPKDLLAQHPDFKDLKIEASNYNPEVNEPVTITIEFELKKDYAPCSILLGSLDSIKYELGQVSSIETVIKGGIKTRKKYIVKFTEPKITNIEIHIYSFSSTEYHYFRTLSFFVGGAFEENEKVIILKSYVNSIKARLNGTERPLIWNNYYEDPEKLDSILASVKTYKKLDPETEKKNDKLLLELKKEYTKLYKGNIDKVKKVIRIKYENKN